MINALNKPSDEKNYTDAAAQFAYRAYGFSGDQYNYIVSSIDKQFMESIGNPADNDCIFVIVLKLEDGTKLFESQELKPGEGLENITLDQELEAGEYQAVIEYKCYSLEDKSPLNGGSAEFKLYVKE